MSGEEEQVTSTSTKLPATKNVPWNHPPPQLNTTHPTVKTKGGALDGRTDNDNKSYGNVELPILFQLWTSVSCVNKGQVFHSLC